MSIKRVNQLGYFKPMEGAPDIKPSDEARQQGRRDLQGGRAEPQPVHLRRRRVRARGGVPERELLRPRTSSAPARPSPWPRRPGSRTKNYQLAITEPYFLDRPITAGVDLFIRRITYLSHGELRGLQPAEPGRLASPRASRWAASRAPSWATRTRSSTSTTLDQNALRTSATPTARPDATADVLAGTSRPGTATPRPPSTSALFGPTDGATRAASPRPGCGTPSTTPTCRARGTRLHRELPVRRRPPRRHRQLLPARRWRRSSTTPCGKRMALGLRGDVGYIHPFGDTTDDPLLPPLLPRGRDPDPRLQRPHRRPR